MTKKIKLIVTLFSILSLISCSKDGYRVEDNKVIYEVPWNEGHGTVIKILKADPETFKVLGDDNLNWAKDKNKVFWGYVYLNFMDSETFEVLSVAFAKDANHVICGDEIVNETNSEDFILRTYIENGKEKIYGVDKGAAYFCSEEPNGYERISSSSIDSFKALGYDYFIDNDIVSWGGLSLKLVDISTFVVLKGGYAKDKESVYYQNKKIDNADVSSFVVIKNDYGKDKNFRYYLHRKIDN